MRGRIWRVQYNLARVAAYFDLARATRWTAGKQFAGTVVFPGKRPAWIVWPEHFPQDWMLVPKGSMEFFEEVDDGQDVEVGGSDEWFDDDG